MDRPASGSGDGTMATVVSTPDGAVVELAAVAVVDPAFSSVVVGGWLLFAGSDDEEAETDVVVVGIASF